MKTYLVLNWTLIKKSSGATIYAELLSSETNEVLLKADLLYLIASSRRHGREIVNAQAIIQELMDAGFTMAKAS